MGSSLLVSVASLVCLTLLPFISSHGSTPSRGVVDALAAFGVGAMLGDAFLHQLPHAFSSGGHTHDHKHSHGHDGHGHGHSDGAIGKSEASPRHAHSIKDLSVGLACLVGILLFFVVEKIVRAVEEQAVLGNSVAFVAHGHGHGHGRGHKAPVAAPDVTAAVGAEDESSVKEAEDGGADDVAPAALQGEERDEEEDDDDERDVWEKVRSGDVQEGEEEPEGAVATPLLPEAPASREEGRSSALRNRKKKATEGIADAMHAEVATYSQPLSEVRHPDGTSAAEDKEAAKAPAAGSLKVLGYLNLFSDGVHNFTDGMALGAAFLHHGTVGGWSRLLFMLAHELPQEVGDFGILLRSGFSVLRALAFNFLSALTAMAGTALALILGGDPGSSSLIEGFTAGGFIYIAVAGVMPDMHNQRTTLGSTLLQLAAMGSGMAVAVAVSLME
eukprot:SM000188S03831  [mRNA]  locus=s188:112668:115957:- [translate_table: standard]